MTHNMVLFMFQFQFHNMEKPLANNIEIIDFFFNFLLPFQVLCRWPDLHNKILVKISFITFCTFQWNLVWLVVWQHKSTPLYINRRLIASWSAQNRLWFSVYLKTVYTRFAKQKEIEWIQSQKNNQNSEEKKKHYNNERGCVVRGTEK